MRLISFACVTLLCLAGCHHVSLKPNTLEPHSIVYATRGGYSMRRAAKDVLEQRGYQVVVGKATNGAIKSDDSTDIEYDSYTVPGDARYVMTIREREEGFRTPWCMFNGFWWWRFNVSIADQETGKEILAWFGHGCANSSTRLFNKILDQLEVQENAPVED